MVLIVLFQLATFLYIEKQENELKFSKTFPESLINKTNYLLSYMPPLLSMISLFSNKTQIILH